MKQIKLLFASILFVVSIFWGAPETHSQNSKDIWTKCIDSIYRKETTLLINPNEKYPIDPINPQIDTTGQRLEYIPFKLYINKNIYQISPDDFTTWIKDKLDVKGLEKIRFSKIIKADSLTIDESKLGFCYEMYNSKTYKVNLKAIESCTSDNVGYTTAKSIILSNILVSDNGKYAVLYSVMRYTDAVIIAVLLKKNKQGWNIVNITKTFYR